MVECESLTTISLAPPASAPSMAAFTSASSSRRPAAASGPSPTHCAQSTTPAVPSMSLDRKTFMPASVYPKQRRRPGAAADGQLTRSGFPRDSHQVPEPAGVLGHVGG